VAAGPKGFIESLLPAAAGFDRIFCRRLVNDGLRLAAFQALFEVGRPLPHHNAFRRSESRHQGGGAACPGVHLDKGRGSIRGFTQLHTGQEQLPPGTFPRDCRRTGTLELMQVPQRGLESQTALLLFNVANAQQPAQGV
jgi:hypothetical protein